MLMISIEVEAAVIAFRLVGRLSDLEAPELARTGSVMRFNQPRRSVLFDLTGLTAVDVAGKEFLLPAHLNGDQLVGGVSTRAIVDEIITSSGNGD